MTGMCMSINKSYFSIVGLTRKLNKLTLYDGDLLNTQPKVKLHFPRQKEIPPTYTTDCENWKCISMSCCGTGLNVWREYIQIRCVHAYTHACARTHTHIPTAHFSYTMSVTHPTTRMHDITKCHPFSAGANVSSTQSSLLFLLQRSTLLKQDACSPVVQICQQKCLLQFYVEMTQDVTVKKRHVEVFSCTPTKQTFSVSVEETSMAPGPVWRVNLLPPPGFKPPSVIPSADFSSSVRCRRTTNHFSHHPINYWLLVCIITFLQQSWNEWQGTLPIARGQYLLDCCQCPHLATTLSRKTCFGHNTCKKLEKIQMYKNTHHRQHKPVHTPCHITNSHHVSTIHKTETLLHLRINLKLTCTGRNILY